MQTERRNPSMPATQMRDQAAAEPDRPSYYDARLAALAEENQELRARVSDLERLRVRDEAVDWPARFRAAADVADDRYEASLHYALHVVGARLHESGDVGLVEAIGRALLGGQP